MSDVEEVKSRLNIADIVAEYVKLNPAGANKKALCPFHSENSPSFMVNEDRQIFHCFGCGKGGDVITFIQEIEGLSFPEALNLLAEKAGVVLTRQNKEEYNLRGRLKTALEAAVIYYQKELKAPPGKTALNYLKDRGVTPQALEKFQLGFAPAGWDNLLKELTAQNFKTQELAQAGLVVMSQKDQSRYYDRFRERIMFPIANNAGAPLGFSARILPGDTTEAGKYINTPQTLLYDKSQALYGLHLAKNEIKQKNLCIILEGNLDVVLSHIAGVENAVATCGTAVTPQQLNIIKRYSPNIAFAFDADSAGLAAAKKGIDLALSLGLNALAINLAAVPGESKDVADIVLESPQTWQNLSHNTQPALEYYFDTILGPIDLSDPQEKRAATEELLEKLALMQNRIDQEHYLNILADKTKTRLETLFDLLDEVVAKNQKSPARNPVSQENPLSIAEKEEVNTPAAAKSRLINRLIGLVVFFPELLTSQSRPVLEAISQEEPKTPGKQILLTFLKAEARLSNPNHYLELLKDSNLKTQAARLITVAEEYFANCDGPEARNRFSPKDDFDFCLKQIKTGTKKAGLTEIAAQIKTAEAEGNQKALKKLLKRYNVLLKEGS